MLLGVEGFQHKQDARGGQFSTSLRQGCKKNFGCLCRPALCTAVRGRGSQKSRRPKDAGSAQFNPQKAHFTLAKSS
jgi:hypothetical protein